jgi:hypothetical protein
MSELVETALRLLPPFNESAGESCPTKVPQWRNTRRCCRPMPRHGRSLALAVDTNVLVYAPMRTRNCIPPAVTGSNSNGRDRCMVHHLGDPVRVSARDNPLVRHAIAMERTGGLEFRCGVARLARPGSSSPDRTARRRRRRVILELPHLADNLLHDTHRRSNARTWHRANLHPRHRFQSIPLFSN